MTEPLTIPVAVDIVALTVIEHTLHALVVRRGIEPFKDHLALPGGFLRDGEQTEEAAARELEEETGIIAQSWQKLGEAYVCNGLMTEKMAIFLARELSFTGQREQSDELFSDMRFFTLDEINELIRNGEINDCQTLAGLHYYQLWRKDTV